MTTTNQTDDAQTPTIATTAPHRGDAPTECPEVDLRECHIAQAYENWYICNWGLDGNLKPLKFYSLDACRFYPTPEEVPTDVLNADIMHYLAERDGIRIIQRCTPPTSSKYTLDNMAAYLQAVGTGKSIEVTEELYWYFLGCIPPVSMGKRMEIDGRTIQTGFEFAEGTERITVFWQDTAGYYCQLSNRVHTGY